MSAASVSWSLMMWAYSVSAVITGITSAAAGSLNRLAELEARLAYGSATPRTSTVGSASPAPADTGAGYAPQPPGRPSSNRPGTRSRLILVLESRVGV